MSRISTIDFLSFCKSLAGQEIGTIGGRAKFMVKVVGDGLEFTPLISGKPRLHDGSYVDRVLDDFKKTQSFTTTRYSGYTANSSYQLALIKRYQDEKKTGKE